jgi:tetratricopeptide (TPR) repeat protein
MSLSSMHGYAFPDLEADYRRAQELATRLGRPEVLPALIALWVYWFTSGRLATARGVLDQLTAMVREPAFAAFEPEVAGLTGVHDLHRGHLTSAQEHSERALAGFAARPAEHRVSPLWPLPNDPVPAWAVTLAAVSATRGELDEARRWEREALRRAEEVGFPRGPVSLAYVNIYVAWIRYFLGDDAAAARAGAEAVAVGEEHGLAFWSAIGATYAATGTPGGAPDREFLGSILAGLELMGLQSFLAFHLAHLARLDAAAGDEDRAEVHLAEAFEAVHRTGEELHLPELLRQRAALGLTRGGDADAAVADLTEALRIATGQGARLSRLRAAVDLARLPAAIRPGNWRILLAEARADMPASTVTAETVSADLLLDR